MCGRFVQSSPVEVLEEDFGPFVSAPPRLSVRYNLSPREEAAVVLLKPEGRVLAPAAWGLASQSKDSVRPINARVETLDRLPAFRESFRLRRCVVPADGFYEWRHEGGRTIPYLARSRSGRPLALAGIWHEMSGSGARTFAIVTCPANDELAGIHERMPAILDHDGVDAWLDRVDDTDRLRAALQPSASDRLEVFEVSSLVNSPHHDSPACIRPASGGSRQLDLFP